MKKVIAFVLIIILVLGVAACSNNNDGVEQAEIKRNESEITGQEETVLADVKVDDSVGKVDKSEIGVRTTLKSKKGLDLTKESGPFTVNLTDIQISHLEPSSSYKDMFGGKDELTLVTIAVVVENNSTDTNSIYPDQGTITTNTKEQKDAHLFLSDGVGGDFIGEIIKSGNIIFLLDSPAEEINSLKYIIGGGSDESFNSLGEDIIFEINFE